VYRKTPPSNINTLWPSRWSSKDVFFSITLCYAKPFLFYFLEYPSNLLTILSSELDSGMQQIKKYFFIVIK